MPNRKTRILGNLLAGLALISGLIGVFSFAYYWDTSRKAVKRLQASSPYKFEEINPKYREVNPAGLIGISSAGDLAAVKRNLDLFIWGGEGFPLSQRPFSVIKNLQDLPSGSRCPEPVSKNVIQLKLECQLDLFMGGENLSGIDQLIVDFKRREIPYRPRVSFFRPKDGNGKLVLYHHGYAGTHLDQWRHILRWVGEGYAVLAFDYMGYGGTEGAFPYNGQEYLKGVFYPIAVALNYALETGRFKDVSMVGLSAGGWTTAVYAALDSRIRKSYPVSGVLPVYLRERKERPMPQLDKGLLGAASYLDLFILASSGENRRQVQIFNRFDRCCYNNERGKLYEDEVAEAVRSSGGGEFKVLIDETHARHKISRWAFDWILQDMERP